ncbi:MAG: cysteine--tRNA ligase, partial [Acidobacteria bacterium]|nr:cysteine--tRNA ligase [Acidobacteriota bacterium]
FDIHGGGQDLIFPHHENEIAQSEAGTGRPFVQYWLHCAHLLVDGEKMSKSLGNFYTVRDLLERGEDPMAIRYLLLSQHYRKPLNFTFEGVRWAATNLERIGDFRRRVAAHPAGPGSDPELRAAVERVRSGFEAALDDDLNASVALAAVFDLMGKGNAACDQDRLRAAEKAEIGDFLARFDGVFGLLEGRGGQRGLEPEIQTLIDERVRARQAREFGRADAIREELERRGILLEDTPAGVRWKRRRGPADPGSGTGAEGGAR